MYSLFETVRQKVANADRGQAEWDAALDAVHGLVRIARRILVAEKHRVVTHLERAVAAAERQDASGVLHHLRLAEVELP